MRFIKNIQGRLANLVVEYTGEQGIWMIGFEGTLKWEWGSLKYDHKAVVEGKTYPDLILLPIDDDDKAINHCDPDGKYHLPCYTRSNSSVAKVMVVRIKDGEVEKISINIKDLNEQVRGALNTPNTTTDLDEEELVELV